MKEKYYDLQYLYVLICGKILYRRRNIDETGDYGYWLEFHEGYCL